jgi:hypothetical protein
LLDPLKLFAPQVEFGLRPGLFGHFLSSFLTGNK